MGLQRELILFEGFGQAPHVLEERPPVRPHHGEAQPVIDGVEGLLGLPTIVQGRVHLAAMGVDRGWISQDVGARRIWVDLGGGGQAVCHKDRRAYQTTIHKMLEWPARRVVMGHGDVLEGEDVSARLTRAVRRPR